MGDDSGQADMKLSLIHIYSPYTLDTEYKRDLGKGLPIEMPVNYDKDDNPDKAPVVRWRGHANLLFSNWLNYYVYQETPFDINEIRLSLIHISREPLVARRGT